MRGSKNLPGPLLTISDPTVAETLLDSGPDLLIADMEHSLIDVPTLQSIVMAAWKIPVLARIRGLEKNEIKKVLDTGASGIIIPGIETVEDAENAVRFSRFAPAGRRGAGPGRASGYGHDFIRYSRESPLVILQIETKNAFADLERITAVKGIDGVFVGPVDLSIALGIEFSWQNDDFVRAVDRIKKRADDLKLITGIYSPLRREVLVEVLKREFNFLMLGMDREALVSSYKSTIEFMIRSRSPE